MKVVALVCWLLGGALLQALLPAWGLLGQACWPVLPAVVLYYSLRHTRALALAAALLAGFLQDALSFIPLGYSSALLVGMVWLVGRFRDEIFIGDPLTHAVLGAVFAAAMTLALYLMLRQTGALTPAPGWLVRKLAGSLVTGALTMPAVFRLLDRMEVPLGLAPALGGGYE